MGRGILWNTTINEHLHTSTEEAGNVGGIPLVVRFISLAAKAEKVA